MESPTQHDIFHLRAICLCRWSPTGSISLFPRCCTTQGGSFITAFKRSARVQGGAGGTRLGTLGSSTLAEIQVSFAPSETDIQYCLRILPEATPEIMRNPPCKWKPDNLGECRSGFSGSWAGAGRKLQDLVLVKHNLFHDETKFYTVNLISEKLSPDTTCLSTEEVAVHRGVLLLSKAPCFSSIVTINRTETLYPHEAGRNNEEQEKVRVGGGGGQSKTTDRNTTTQSHTICVYSENKGLRTLWQVALLFWTRGMLGLHPRTAVRKL